MCPSGKNHLLHSQEEDIEKMKREPLLRVGVKEEIISVDSTGFKDCEVSAYYKGRERGRENLQALPFRPS